MESATDPMGQPGDELTGAPAAGTSEEPRPVAGLPTPPAKPPAVTRREREKPPEMEYLEMPKLAKIAAGQIQSAANQQMAEVLEEAAKMLGITLAAPGQTPQPGEYVIDQRTMRFMRQKPQGPALVTE